MRSPDAKLTALWPTLVLVGLALLLGVTAAALSPARFA